MRILASILFLVTGTAATLPSNTTRGKVAAGCLPDTAQYAIITRDNVAGIVSGTTSEDSTFRAMGQLPQIAANQVQIVQTDSICQVAAAALVSAWGSGSASDSTWVIRIGTTRNLVFNLKQVSDGKASALVFDSTFNYVAALRL